MVASVIAWLWASSANYVTTLTISKGTYVDSHWGELKLVVLSLDKIWTSKLAVYNVASHVHYDKHKNIISLPCLLDIEFKKISDQCRGHMVAHGDEHVTSLNDA